MKGGFGSKLFGGASVIVDIVRGAITLGKAIFGKKPPPTYDDVFPNGTKTERELRDMADVSMVYRDEPPPRRAADEAPSFGTPKREDSP